MRRMLQKKIEPKDPFQRCFLSGRVLTSKRREFSPATKLINYFSGEAGKLENKKNVMKDYSLVGRLFLEAGSADGCSLCAREALFTSECALEKKTMSVFCRDEMLFLALYVYMCASGGTGFMVSEGTGCLPRSWSSCSAPPAPGTLLDPAPCPALPRLLVWDVPVVPRLGLAACAQPEAAPSSSPRWQSAVPAVPMG